MLNIFDWLRGHSKDGRTATEIYGSIVTQARLPVFYRDYGVADVAEKRYEMIVLHMIITLERLRSLGTPAAAVSRALVEAFVRDLDGSMRELAVSDTKVPTKVKKAAGGLHDRDVLYRAAFSSHYAVEGDQTEHDPMTPAALIDELIFDGRNAARAGDLLGYVEAARHSLQNWTLPDDTDIELPFPSPTDHLEEMA